MASHIDQPSAIVLSNTRHIAEGRRQNVYEHPLDPTALIKLPKPETIDANGNLKKRRFGDRFRRATGYRDFLREFQEFLELKARYQQPGAKLPLCEVRGIVQTDLGIGLVYERISNPDGQLAPTLKALIASGKVSAQHISDLEVHFLSMMENRIVLSNFRLDNIVYQSFEAGSGRFVWVDSIGSKQFVPTRKWFKFLNDRKLKKIWDNCLEKIASAPKSPSRSPSSSSNSGQTV